MNTLIFHNPGEIDIRGACIAGLSAKESKSPIGYFGTGLKYAIASILRWGGEISIYSGNSKYTFEAVDLTFRGQDFKQITMNGDALGFTTEYGKDWKPWQVFRELYANARDEGGDVQLRQDVSSMSAEGKTHILVRNVPDLIETYYNRDEIILPVGKVWAHESDKVQFTDARSSGLYYRGVRVHEQACLFTWNFLNQLTLTEDRSLSSVMEASHEFDVFIKERLPDVEVIMTLLTLKFDEEPKITRTITLDGEPTTLTQRAVEGLFMDWFYIPATALSHHSAAFKSACTRLYQRDPTTFSKLRSYVKSIDEKLVEEKLHRMTPREQQMLDKAKELVAIFGFEDEINRCPIHVQELGGQTLGIYENGTIYLSPKLFDQGTKQLVATLYEECYHHRTQNKDCTYSMQSDLFNIIISLNEEVHKVIC
jgi:hypothetical protein